MEIFDSLDAEEPLLALTDCVHLSPGFSVASPLPDGPLELAAFDATLCPESLGISTEKFNDLYRGKVAVWIGQTKMHPKTCNKSFYLPSPWYERMLNAGALGVVYINEIVGIHPGIFHQVFDRAFNDDIVGSLDNASRVTNIASQSLIPSLECSIEPTNWDSPYSETALESFIRNWILEPSERAFPYNQTLYVGNVTVSDNEWEALLASPLYAVAFRGFVPLLCFFTFLLAVYFLRERLREAHDTKHSYRAGFTAPLVAMQIEAASALFLGLFYAIDGWWSVDQNAMMVLRPLVVGQLMFLTIGTTLLVGLSFRDFRIMSQNVAVAKTTLAKRYRKAIWCTSLMLVGFESLGIVVRLIFQERYEAFNAAGILLAFLAGLWFVREKHYFAKLIRELSSADASGVTTHLFLMVLKHITRWAVASSTLLFILILIALVFAVHPVWFWQVNTFGPLWFSVIVLRILYSLSKIVLCRLPSNLRNTGRRTDNVERRMVRMVNRSFSHDIMATPVNLAAGVPAFRPFSDSEDTSSIMSRSESL